MSRMIKKALAFILVLAMVSAVGIFSISAAEIAVDEAVSDDPVSITVHARQEGLSQPYIYLWNSLPTNSAMSKSYPGEKMTASGEWFTYSISDVTKVNVLITDADGKQYWMKVVFEQGNQDGLGVVYHSTKSLMLRYYATSIGIVGGEQGETITLEPAKQLLFSGKKTTD